MVSAVLSMKSAAFPSGAGHLHSFSHSSTFSSLVWWVFVAWHPRRWEGLLGMGTSGKKGTEEWNLETGTNPEDQGCRGPPPEQQDVKAESVRHCAATTAPRNCGPNCHAEQSHKDNVCSSAVWKQLKQKKSNSLSLTQHHLPALDLFWDSCFVRVQLTSLLLILPELVVWWLTSWYIGQSCRMCSGVSAPVP